MPIRPRAPARPAPMIWVGVEAPPVDEEEAAVPDAAVVLAAPDEAAALLVAAALEVIVEFKNLPVAVELLLNKAPPVAEIAAVVGTAESAAVMK